MAIWPGPGPMLACKSETAVQCAHAGLNPVQPPGDRVKPSRLYQGPGALERHSKEHRGMVMEGLTNGGEPARQTGDEQRASAVSGKPGTGRAHTEET